VDVDVAVVGRIRPGRTVRTQSRPPLVVGGTGERAAVVTALLGGAGLADLAEAADAHAGGKRSSVLKPGPEAARKRRGVVRSRTDDWEDVDDIYLEGYTRGFFGVEPDLIADVRNPAILLFEGREYDLTWENGDGGTHNIAIRDENREVVDGLGTRTMRDRGETQTLEFEATSEMHEYLCEPHPASMLGYFKVVD